MTRVRKVEYTDAPLDSLLRHEEPEPVRVADKGYDSWVPRAGLHAFIASAVVYTGFHIVGLAPPYPLILAVCVGAVLVRRAVALAAEPPSRTRTVVQAPRPPRRATMGGWYRGDDGMVEAVHRWDRRLDWGATAPERFRHTMTGRLGDLVDERLRQRHGFTRASDPTRARALVGEDVWRLIDGSASALAGSATSGAAPRPSHGDRVPSPRDVYQLVQRMESL